MVIMTEFVITGKRRSKMGCQENTKQKIIKNNNHFHISTLLFILSIPVEFIVLLIMLVISLF